MVWLILSRSHLGAILEGAGSTLTMVPGLVELTSLFVEVICTMASFACGPGKFSLRETLATAEVGQ